MLRIEQERINRGLKLRNIAQMLETTESTVCDIEKGRCKPSYEKLLKLEDFFNLTHRQLFAVVDDNNLSK